MSKLLNYIMGRKEPVPCEKPAMSESNGIKRSFVWLKDAELVPNKNEDGYHWVHFTLTHLNPRFGDSEGTLILTLNEKDIIPDTPAPEESASLQQGFYEYGFILCDKTSMTPLTADEINKETIKCVFQPNMNM